MRVIFLGTQGSGKSTQAKTLADELRVPYIEMGQLLRDKSKDEDAEGLAIRKALDVGNLVPNEITIKALQQRVAKDDCKKGFVLDGYPRNKEQLENMPDDIDKAIYINVPDEESTDRLLKRGREDDNLSAIKRRLKLFHQETEPVLSYFRDKGILVEIDGRPTIEEVAKVIKSKVENGQSQN